MDVLDAHGFSQLSLSLALRPFETGFKAETWLLGTERMAIDIGKTVSTYCTMASGQASHPSPETPAAKFQGKQAPAPPVAAKPAAVSHCLSLVLCLNL